MSISNAESTEPALSTGPDAQTKIDRSEATLEGAELDDKHDTQEAPEDTGWDINDDPPDSNDDFADALETLQTESLNCSQTIEINIGLSAQNPHRSKSIPHTPREQMRVLSSQVHCGAVKKPTPSTSEPTDAETNRARQQSLELQPNFAIFYNDRGFYACLQNCCFLV